MNGPCSQAALGPLVGNSLRAGRKLRRQRRVASALAAAATVGLIAVIVPAAYGSLATTGHQHRPTAVGLPEPTAYVATSAQTVVPINLRSSSALKPIRLKVPGIPVSMAIAPDGRTIYVVSLPETKQGNAPPPRVGGYVTPISTATDRTRRPIWLRGDPGQILITPDGRTGYVLSDTGLVPECDSAVPAATPAIQIRDAFEMAMTPNGKTIYLGAGVSGKGYHGQPMRSFRSISAPGKPSGRSFL